MLDTMTGEVVNRTLMHEGNEVREFYSQLPRPAVVGIEAIGPMQWFLNLLEELEKKLLQRPTSLENRVYQAPPCMNWLEPVRDASFQHCGKLLGSKE
jgi:hypothetical protein